MRRIAIPLVVCSLLAGAGTAPRACTNFCFDTPHGPVFGCNLDLLIPGDGLVFVNQRGMAKEGFQPGTTGEVARWVSTYGSVTFNVAGREFAFGGMNEAGLVVASMELRASEFPERDARPGVTIGTWAQYVLDTCGNIDEVVGVDARVRIEDSAPPVHFLIADSTGRCVGIEWLDGELVVYRRESLPVRAMSNMPYGRALAAWERGGPRWWWSNPGRSAERFADAHERCTSYDADRDGDPIRYAFDTLTRVVGAPHTRWNIVYGVAGREIWFRSVRGPGVKHLALRDFDLSCDAPLLMLDVNADIEGEVADAFVPYDRDVNLGVLLTLCQRYELGVSYETARELVDLFEGFACAP